MTELSLRAYIDFIEDRLARDAAAEAVAQCRHVLSVYPKHIDTYRVLARATAAQANFMDALDLFQRVLSADPGDFVAHIGMSECYKEDAALDQSIWHLERAFEQVPSNRDLQNELKKLYEQRDGRAPLKVQMTSGALARMYLKGKLYDQAIAELSKALEHDPERLDLQVLLADALWNNHQEVASGKVAAEVLRKLPNSIDANRILAQLWLKAGQPGEARPFLDRVKELDPYAAYRVERGENAPADSFRLTALEFTSEAHASQVGAADWVSEIKGIEKQKGVSGPLKGGENITDIFSTPSSAPAPSDQPEAPASSATPPSPASAPSQMGAPDWLRSALGTGALQANASTQPDWLKDVLNDPTAAPSAPPSTMPQTTDSSPDWLKDVVGSEPPAQPAPPAAAPAASEGAPDWLKETLEQGTPPASMPPVPEASSGPDWLKDVTGGTPPAQPAPPAAPGGKTTPAWLSDVLNEQTPTGVQKPVAGEDRPAPAWLDDVLAGTPAAPPPEVSPKVVTTDMLNKIITEGSDTLPEPKSGSGPLKKGSSPLDFASLGELETWDGPLPPIPMQETDTINPPPPLDDAEVASPPPADWLTQETGLKREPKEEVKTEDSGELPGWLMSDAPISPKKEAAAPEESESSDVLPDWLSGDTSDIPKPKAAAPEEEVEDSGEVPDWLKGDKEDIPKPKAAKVEEKEEDSGELPDWLKGADSAPAKETPKAEEKVGTGELPDWLKSDEEAPAEELDDLLAAALEDDKEEDEEPEAVAEVKEKSASEATEPAPAAIKEDDAVAPPDEGTPDGGGDDVPDWLSNGDLDSDDAMKWLEEMAAKIDPNFKAEGSDAAPVAEAAPAAEETKEEEEGEGDLEWLRAPTESEEDKPAAVAETKDEDEEEETPDWLKPEGEGAKASVAPTDPDTAEALAWLDEQVKEQGAAPGKPLEEQLTEDRPPVATMPKIADPDAEAEAADDAELPDWLKDAGAQEERAKAMDAPDSAPELADIPELPVEADELAWLNEALEAEEKSGDDSELEELFAEAKKAEGALSDDEKSELPDWMKEDAPAKSEAKAEKDDEELPAWLKGDAEEEKKPEPAKAEKEPEPVAEVKVSDSDELPDWLKGGAEEEPVTAGGGLTAFLQAVEPAIGADKQEEPEAKKPEPEPEPAKAEAKAEPEPAKAAPPPPPPAAIPKPIPAGEAGETLKSAREQMSNGELQKALEIYESLVASGHGQDETISDLMEIVKTRAVVNPKVYRVIGDALIGKGEMQEAMEYYKKALDNF